MKNRQGEDREEKYRPYRKGLARLLNQVQCGQETQTYGYLNCQTIGAVGRITQLLEVVAESTGQLEGGARPRRCVGGCSPPSQGWALGRLKELGQG